MRRNPQVDHPAAVHRPALGRMVGQLGQGLGAGDANAHRNAGVLEHPLANATAKVVEVARHAGQVREGFVDGIHLQCRDHAFDYRHYALAHVAVQRVVG
ncbi:hypothetical protein D3C79_791280 [compost metagenome]